VLIAPAWPVFFCVTDFWKRCNAKEANFAETNFVKQRIYFVKRRFFRIQQFAISNWQLAFVF
jgi:hypothetical protein